MSPEEAPTLALHVEPAADGGYTVMLRVSRFTFSKEHADGDHIPGLGHAHIYVGGKKIARVYATTYSLGSLTPGKHEISVGLFTNNHMAYATGMRPVAATVVVETVAR